MTRALSIIPALMMGVLSILALSIPPSRAADPQAFVVEKSGAGRPVVFIPGLSSSGEVWSLLKADLGPGYETHVITLAGFAGVPPVQGPFLETRLAALEAYLEAENLEDAVIVGHSLGGFMAMKLALAAPDRIGDVVIVDSVPFLAQFFLRAQTVAEAEPRAAALRDQLLQFTDEQHEAQQRGLAAASAREPEAQAIILEGSLASDRETSANAVYELLTSDLREEIANIRAPMLVLYPWRAGGPFAAEQTDAAYAAQYANAKTATLKRIDDATHFIMLDRPEETYEAVAAFLEE